ncbi:MAG: hypothetical protein COB38_02465 [Gammaproteobacteria bacterium]|nr:MAG: hypothetical protein COB38_02465 [Gammaproteobacteria bacterium]
MTQDKINPSISFILVAVIAIIFGVLTIKSGGEVIFLDGIARMQAGNYSNFVVWFNFLAGFFYITAGIGIFFRKYWSVLLSRTIAIMTILIFLILGLTILNDGLYEMRTIIAMSLRSSVWIIVAFFAYKKISTNS